MYRRMFACLALGLTVYGLTLRLVHPQRAMFWNDEVWTALQSTGHSFADVIHFTADPRVLSAQDFVSFQRAQSGGFGSFIDSDPHSSPLYYSMCWVMIRWFGDHILATRWLTALLGCFSLFAVYLAARELWQSRSAGLVALVCAAISPAQVYLAFEARPYTLWALTAPLSTYFFLRAHRAHSWCAWLAYAFAATVMLYSHLYGLFVIMAHVAYMAVSPNSTRQHWRRFANSLGYVALVACPWLIAIASRLKGLHDLTQWLSVPMSATEAWEVWRSALLWQFGTYRSVPGWPHMAMLAVVAFLAILTYATVDAFRSAPREATSLAVVLTFSLPMALWLVDTVFGGRRFETPRYFVASWFGIQLLLGRWVANFVETPSPRSNKIRFAFSSIVAATLAVSAVRGAWMMCYSRLPEGKPDAFLLAVSEEVGKATQPVLISSGLVSTPLILANLIPPSTTILSLRHQTLMLDVLEPWVRSREVFLLRPAPEIVHPEPRRAESEQLARELGEHFRIKEVRGTKFLVRLWPR